MATSRDQTSIEGALYEMVARGVKDKQFIKDEKESVHPFQWTQDRYPASLPEIRHTNPLNQPRFGQRFEIEFELPADVLAEATLLIDLPTWLPPSIAESNPTADIQVSGSSPQQVQGYVNGIGYFLFSKIEIQQDNLLLQEVSGDALQAAQLTRSSQNQGFLTQQLAGCHDGSAKSIQRNATPGQLEIPVPMIGCSWPGDRGLTLCGLRQQTFRLRLTLRNLEELVETNTDDLHPAPWLKEFTRFQPGLLTLTNQAAIPRPQIGQPNVVLRTKQLYLLNEARSELTTKTIEVPQLRYFVNHFGVNQLDQAPIDVGAVPVVKYWLDANQTVERLVIFIRNSLDVARNRLWKFDNSVAPNGQQQNQLQLQIAGQLREGPWAPDFWQRTVTDAKQERSPGRNIATMDWSRGWTIDGEPPNLREPTGGINFTTADRPFLTVGQNDILVNPELGQKQAELIVVCESWALQRIRDRRGRLEQAN